MTPNKFEMGKFIVLQNIITAIIHSRSRKHLETESRHELNKCINVY